MNLTRTHIVDLARNHVGVPWRHMGRDHTGVDCVGLLISVWCDLGLSPQPKIPPYRAQPDGTMLRYFQKYMQPVVNLRSLKPGTAVVYSFQGSPYHAGIVLDPDRGSIVHALASKKRVVVDMLHHGKKTRKLLCAWDFPGVIDG